MIKETRESRVARRDAFTAERADHEAGNNSDGGINATAWGVRHEASDLGGICVLSGTGTGHGRGGPSDRTSAGEGKRVSVRVDLGVHRRFIKKKFLVETRSTTP